ncbi:MAG: elongation factor P [Phototrophicales bacterium]|jgi:elongation factor P|nr:MAG: elongation factor P [Phototrophicales bacterium]
MIDVNQLRKGTIYLEDNNLLRVLDYTHNKTGRGGATIRVVVRNLRTGATFERTYPSGNRVEDVRLESSEVEYLYDDGEFLTFMDQETYDQPQLRRDIFGDDTLYLKEGMKLKLVRYQNEIIDYELPTSVDMLVTESEMAVAGDTANSPSKKVTTETGLVVQVPLFVKEGDTIRIKTEDGSYMTRV